MTTGIAQENYPQPQETGRGEVQFDQAQNPIRFNKIRKIQITQEDHGYIVTVGCQTIALESLDKLILKLSEYLREPAATETKYNNKELL